MHTFETHITTSHLYLSVQQLLLLGEYFSFNGSRSAEVSPSFSIKVTVPFTQSVDTKASREKRLGLQGLRKKERYEAKYKNAREQERGRQKQKFEHFCLQNDEFDPYAIVVPNQLWI